MIITIHDQWDNIIDEAPAVYKIELGCAIASPTNRYSAQKRVRGNELLFNTDR